MAERRIRKLKETARTEPLAGPTRFYLTGANADYNVPPQGAWDFTSSIYSDHHLLEPDKTLFTMSDTGANSSWSTSAATKRVEVYRGLSRKLLPQTISGTVNMVVGVRESNSAGNFYTRLHIYVWNKTAGSVHGILLDRYEESAAGGATEWPTASTGVALRATQTLTSVTIPNDSNDYRLVAEMGYVSYSTASSGTITGYLNIGTRGNYLEINPDLTVGLTPAGGKCGFLEFSAAIALGPYTWTNMSMETATQITSLPFSITVTPPAEENAQNALWYKFQFPEDRVMSMTLCSPSGATYFFVEWQIGSPAGPPIVTYFGSISDEEPQMWAVKAGELYYFELYTQDPTSQSVKFGVDLSPIDDIQRGDLYISADDPGINRHDSTIYGTYPSIWYTPTGTVRHLDARFPSSELGACLRNGKFGLLSFPNNDFHIYNSDFTQAARITMPNASLEYPEFGGRGLGTDFTSFYIIIQVDEFISPCVLHKVSDTGVFVANWTLPGTGSGTGFNMAGDAALGVARNGSIIYYGKLVRDGLVQRHDLVNNVALTPFSAPVSPSGRLYYTSDSLVMSDGTIVVLFDDPSASNIILHFSPSGTVLHTLTYPRGTQYLTGVHHIAITAEDDPDLLWVWRMINTGGQTDGTNTFELIRISTGAVLQSFTKNWFQYGAGEPYVPNPCNPIEKFGAPNSCPFFAMIGKLPAGGIYELVPDKRQDTIYVDPGVGTTQNTPIPNPNIQTGFIGS